MRFGCGGGGCIAISEESSSLRIYLPNHLFASLKICLTQRHIITCFELRLERVPTSNAALVNPLPSLGLCRVWKSAIPHLPLTYYGALHMYCAAECTSHRPIEVHSARTHVGLRKGAGPNAAFFSKIDALLGNSDVSLHLLDRPR